LEELLGRHKINPERGNVYDSSDLESMQETQKDSKSRIRSVLLALIVIVAAAVAAFYLWPNSPAMDKTNISGEDELTVTQITNLYDEGKFEPAVKALVKYVASNPSDSNMREMLASSYLMTGKNSEAINEYETLLKAKPNDADLQYKIGIIKQKMDQQQDAIAYLKRASEASPNVLLFKIELARASTKAKQYEDAIKEWKSALDLLPENDGARVNIIAELANVYLIQTNFKEAQKILDKGLQIDPENTELKALVIKSGGMLNGANNQEQTNKDQTNQEKDSNSEYSNNGR
jgi:tetratricopeptide (TPR) repeat protein